jgi:hypothetical protein
MDKSLNQHSILSFEGSNHGNTFATLAASSNNAFAKVRLMILILKAGLS